MNWFKVSTLTLLSLLLLLWACSPTPRITGATLGTLVQNGKIEQPKTTFARTDRMIHLIVDVENALNDTVVGAKWYRVGDTKALLFEGEAVIDAFNTTADFSINNTNDWIPGNFQVVLFLNGKEDRALNFEVK